MSETSTAERVGRAEIEPLVLEILGSSDPSKLFEKKVVQFAVEKELAAAVDMYLKRRIYPVAVGLGVGLTIFGLTLHDIVISSRSNTEVAARELEDRRKDIEKALADVQSKVAGAREELNTVRRDVEASRGRVESARIDFENSHRRQWEELAVAKAELKRAQDQIQGEARQLENVRSHVSGVGAELRTIQGTAGTINDELVTQRKELREHKRMLGAPVIEFVTLRSDKESTKLHLQKEGEGHHAVVFRTEDIKPEFKLHIEVDGRSYVHIANYANVGVRFPIPGTRDRYVFSLDHLFHARGSSVPDFITLRVGAADNIQR